MITQIYNAQVTDRRSDITTFTALSSTILATTTALYLQRRPSAPKSKPIEKTMSLYRDLITETTEPPPPTTNTIKVNTLDDLDKTAEIFARPILHTHTDTQHTFYILDTNNHIHTQPQPPTTS